MKSNPADLRPFNLGFTMGMNLGGYDMTSTLNQFDPDIKVLLRRVELIRKPGINLGLITNLKLHNNIDFRFLPSVSLEQRDFNFVYATNKVRVDSVARKRIESSNLNLPFVFKFKSNYYDVYRVYAQIGMQYSINMASTKKVRNDPDLLKTVTGDWTILASFGVDLYGEKLKLNPEFRYTMGIRNIYEPKNTRFATAITDLFSQSLMILINFE
ncbi:MAG: PorT family protein [Bacteroidia bacterium]|nr:PorT family protein [Bacteroidia bacterium]